MSDKKDRVLIIEDEPGTALLLVEFLQLRGFLPRWAKDGIQGLENSKRWLPDAILLDIMIPGKNGFDLLIELKSNPKTKAIPVLICSATEKMSDIARWIEWGAAGYLPKPFDLKHVHEKIKQALEEKNAAANAVSVGILHGAAR